MWCRVYQESAARQGNGSSSGWIFVQYYQYSPQIRPKLAFLCLSLRFDKTDRLLGRIKCWKPAEPVRRRRGVEVIHWKGRSDPLWSRPLPPQRQAEGAGKAGCRDNVSDAQLPRNRLCEPPASQQGVAQFRMTTALATGYTRFAVA